MQFFDILDRAREISPKLDASKKRRFKNGLANILKRPFGRINGKRVDRRRLFEDAVVNLLAVNGHSTEVEAARRGDGSIDWEALFTAIVKYLPQILEILLKFLPLFV